MTDKTEELKADISLEERQRIDREKQNEIREGIRNRHLNLPTEACAVDRRS
ncbi:MAG: hypothetical protein WCS75_01620 [Sphingomonas sp.]|jgi:hypothetical protein|uniref:hypothetical protein n=1 Tax=Sphingomonas sp. TaxID=28214 RepID=UPI003568FE8C